MKKIVTVTGYRLREFARDGQDAPGQVARVSGTSSSGSRVSMVLWDGDARAIDVGFRDLTPEGSEVADMGFVVEAEGQEASATRNKDGRQWVDRYFNVSKDGFRILTGPAQEMHRARVAAGAVHARAASLDEAGDPASALRLLMSHVASFARIETPGDDADMDEAPAPVDVASVSATVTGLTASVDVAPASVIEAPAAVEAPASVDETPVHVANAIPVETGSVAPSILDDARPEAGTIAGVSADEAPAPATSNAVADAAVAEAVREITGAAVPALTRHQAVSGAVIPAPVAPDVPSQAVTSPGPSGTPSSGLRSFRRTSLRETSVQEDMPTEDPETSAARDMGLSPKAPDASPAAGEASAPQSQGMRRTALGGDAPPPPVAQKQHARLAVPFGAAPQRPAAPPQNTRPAVPFGAARPAAAPQRPTALQPPGHPGQPQPDARPTGGAPRPGIPGALSRPAASSSRLAVPGQVAPAQAPRPAFGGFRR